MEEPVLYEVRICGNSQLVFRDIVHYACLYGEYDDVKYNFVNHHKHVEVVIYKAMNRQQEITETDYFNPITVAFSLPA